MLLIKPQELIELVKKQEQEENERYKNPSDVRIKHLNETLRKAAESGETRVELAYCFFFNSTVHYFLDFFAENGYKASILEESFNLENNTYVYTIEVSWE